MYGVLIPWVGNYRLPPPRRSALVKNSLAGLRRYLYEFQFYLDITQIRHQTGNTITVSAARELRSKGEEILRAQGLSMDDARLPLADAQAAFHEVLQDVPGGTGVYAGAESRGAQNPGYAEARQEFFASAGFAAPGSAGKNGPLLPISPYDPRWAVRSTVKNAGSSLLFITDADIEQRSGGNSVASLIARDPELRLYSINEDQKMFLAGPAYSRDDLSGMTELMGYMTRREYRLVRDWVVDQDTREYMSEKGLARAKAVLDELQSQGVGYKIVRDRNRGQLAVHVEDTKISVRLTHTPARHLLFAHLPHRQDWGRPLRPAARRCRGSAAHRTGFAGRTLGRQGLRRPSPAGWRGLLRRRQRQKNLPLRVRLLRAWRSCSPSARRL